eukprot:CAMPEP_0170084708 /NCGR_PEP_ID=MMETSP0019_2-20121128/19816_1 /TAXON_ID=98059 /ORGANISM="Dinobryon sp., Strain UTEXLB2267" /LENGTH=53 /DNA_ID=CAMNT_0010300889 /DNA_START=146 /DNA_END=307 /DNA_ORIENTATION=+
MNDLHFLSADSCVLIGSATMRAIAEKHCNLMDLFVNKCMLVDDDALGKIANSE